MASTDHGVRTSVFCLIDRVGGRDYQRARRAVLPQLCSNVVLGQDYKVIHDSITVLLLRMEEDCLFSLFVD